MKFNNRREEILAKIEEKNRHDKSAAAFAEMCDVARANKQPLLHADHKLPTTRRELLAAGLVSGIGFVALPNLLGLASSKAYGAELVCSKGSSSSGANSVPGYAEIHLSGGWSLAHNVYASKAKDGSFEPLSASAYATLALGPSQLPGAVTPVDMGAMVQPNAAFYQGLRQMASAATLAKVKMAFMANQSGDDNGNNPLNITDLVSKINGGGALTQAVESGKRHRAAFSDPALSRANVADESSLSSMVDPGLIATILGNGNEVTGKENAIQTAKAAFGLTQNKLDAMSARLISEQSKNLIACGYKGAADLLVEFTAENITPSNDAQITGTPFANGVTFDQINSNANMDSQQKAIIAGKLLGEGLAATSVLEMGGYDYHGRGRAAQDQRDLAVGQVVGLMLEVSARKGSPLFISVMSDGSVASGGAGGADDRFDFNSDSGSRGAILMIGLGATEAPPLKQAYIGAFSDSGAVDTGHLVTSASPQLGAFAVAYNYAAMAGKMSEFSKIVSASGVDVGAFNEKEYLAFAPKK
jgi:hypothetical protein